LVDPSMSVKRKVTVPEGNELIRHSPDWSTSNYETG
jgi:hypothetical protein